MSSIQYPKRHNLELPYNNLFTEMYCRYYDSGHGIHIELCGCVKKCGFLIPFNSLPYIELYHYTTNSRVLNEHIMFPNAYSPWGLLQLLSGYSTLFNRCQTSMMEICLKYYCAESKAKSLKMSHMDHKNDIIHAKLEGRIIRLQIQTRVLSSNTT
jgi:hypothetical protein